MSKTRQTGVDVSAVFSLVVIVICIVVMFLLARNGAVTNTEKQLMDLKKLINHQNYDMTITHYENAAAAEDGYAHIVFKLTPNKADMDKIIWFFGNSYEDANVLLIRQWRGRGSLDASLWKVSPKSPDTDPWKEVHHTAERIMQYADVTDIIKYAKSITNGQSLYSQAVRALATPTPTGE